MKDELSGAPMIEFVGLREKLYAYRQRKWLMERGDIDDMNTLNELDATEDEVKKCKGVGKLAVKHDLLFEHYKRCLLHQEKKSVQIVAIQSQFHRVKTVCQGKVALAYYDDKRWHVDGVSSATFWTF